MYTQTCEQKKTRHQHVNKTTRHTISDHSNILVRFPIQGEKLVQHILHRFRFINAIYRAQRIIQSHDMVIWQIGNFSMHHQLHKMSEIPEFRNIASEIFTLPNGYKFRLKLFANGVGNSRGKYVSVYLQMVATEATEVIYPFRGVLTFVVVDQSTNGKHISTSIRASGANPSFQKPTSQFNPENGLTTLVEHESLGANRTEDALAPAFICKNALTVGVSIRYNKNVR